MKKKIYLAASLICSDPLNVENDVKQLISGSADLIHFDVMDGSFVPRYGLYPEILTGLKNITTIPVDVHMMVDNPEDYIETFRLAGADYYNVHVESCKHLHRTVKKIRDCGMKPGVALNPATPISSLEWIIKDIEMVVLMAINPGIVGHKLIPSMLDKIKLVREYANHAGNEDLIIEIDGGVTFESAQHMIEAGADALVCGTGTIFRPHEDSIHNKLHSLRNHISNVNTI
jgi:ribulose-phosphate 3-epimerase